MLIAGIPSLGAQAQGQGSKGPEVKMSAVPQTLEWPRLKTSVGNREGIVEMAGKQVPATVEVGMTGDGAAIMHVMDTDGTLELDAGLLRLARVLAAPLVPGCRKAQIFSCASRSRV